MSIYQLILGANVKYTPSMIDFVHPTYPMKNHKAKIITPEMWKLVLSFIYLGNIRFYEIKTNAFQWSKYISFQICYILEASSQHQVNL